MTPRNRRYPGIIGVRAASRSSVSPTADGSAPHDESVILCSSSPSALIMALTGLIVFALAVPLGRGRDFSLLEVLGTTPGQIRGLVLVEVGYATIVGSFLGSVLGLGFAPMLIKILTSIFDPPADAPQTLPSGLSLR